MAVKNFLVKRMALGQIEKAFKDQFQDLKTEPLRKVDTRKEVEQMYKIPTISGKFSEIGIKTKELIELAEKIKGKELARRS